MHLSCPMICRLLAYCCLCFASVVHSPGSCLAQEVGLQCCTGMYSSFCVLQANSEVSALLGRIPSAVGYQPTLATDLGTLQERITTTKKGSITSVQVTGHAHLHYISAGSQNCSFALHRYRHPGTPICISLQPALTYLFAISFHFPVTKVAARVLKVYLACIPYTMLWVTFDAYSCACRPSTCLLMT